MGQLLCHILFPPLKPSPPPPPTTSHTIRRHTYIQRPGRGAAPSPYSEAARSNNRDQPSRSLLMRPQQALTFNSQPPNYNVSQLDNTGNSSEAPSTSNELPNSPLRQGPYTTEALRPVIQTWRQRPSTELSGRDPVGQAAMAAAEDDAEDEVIELAANTGAERGIVCILQQNGSNSRDEVRNREEGGIYRVADEIERALRWQMEESLKQAVAQHVRTVGRVAIPERGRVREETLVTMEMTVEHTQWPPEE